MIIRLYRCPFTHFPEISINDNFSETAKFYMEKLSLCLSLGTPATMLKKSLFQNINFNDLKNLNFTHTFANSGRKAIYFGPKSYSYNGIVHEPLDLPTGILSDIFYVISSIFKNHFNSMMIHYYENGLSYIPCHSDDESSIEINSVILSLSIGETRTFNIMSKSDNKTIKSFNLEHGDLLFMSHQSQRNFKHELPQITGIRKKPRISLTFRKMCVG